MVPDTTNAARSYKNLFEGDPVDDGGPGLSLLHRIKGMVVKDVLNTGRPSGSTIDIIASLPLDMREKAATELLDGKRFEIIQTEWLSYDPMESVKMIPDVEDDIQKIIEG